MVNPGSGNVPLRNIRVGPIQANDITACWSRESAPSRGPMDCTHMPVVVACGSNRWIRRCGCEAIVSPCSPPASAKYSGSKRPQWGKSCSVRRGWCEHRSSPANHCIIPP